MNRDVLFTFALLGCCLVAIGTGAAAMTAAVDTTPDDAINLRYESIPLDGDTVDRLKDQLQTSETGVPSQRAAAGAGGQSGPAAGERGARGAGGPDGEDPGLGPGGGGALADLLDRILDLLVAVLEVLAVLLAGVLTLAGLGLGYRHRHRYGALVRWVRASVGRSRPDRITTSAAGTAPPPRPENEVAVAYFELVRRLGLADRLAMTPAECADRAVDAGVDPTAVDRLTTLYEQVRYGGAPVTDGRRRRSRRALDQVLDQLGEA